MVGRAVMIGSATCFIASLGLTTRAAELHERGDLEKGEALYRSLCERCHGRDGEATSYPGVVPLVGVQLRLDGDEIIRLAAGTLGRSFDADEGRALQAFLQTLRGAKGFPQAGRLFPPYLAERKLPKVRQYRMVDARTRVEYDAGHIPNAVHWPHPLEPSARRLSPDETASVLGRLGVTPETFVVLYDDGGGLRASRAWWALVSAGHDRTAVLDGGWRRWVDEDRQVQTAPASIPPGSYPTGGAALPDDRCDLGSDRARALRLDWQDVIDGNGFRSADEIASALQEAGFQGPGAYLTPGPSADAPGAALVLRLLGHESVVVHPRAGGLCVGAS